MEQALPFLPNEVGVSATMVQALERLGLAVVLGVIFAVVYHLIQRRERVTLSNLPYTMILFCTIVCGMMLAIGNSVTKAFGMLGAISLMRFRLNVQNPTDMVAVLFSLTLGVSSAVAPVSTTLLFASVVLVVFAGLHRYHDIRYRLRRNVLLSQDDNQKIHRFLAETHRLFQTSHVVAGVDSQGKSNLWNIHLSFPNAEAIERWEHWLKQDTRLLFTELKYQINLNIGQWDPPGAV